MILSIYFYFIVYVFRYRIPDDNKVAIGGKLKVIAMDTKLLKTMKKATSNTLNACATKTEDPTEDENSLTPVVQ